MSDEKQNNTEEEKQEEHIEDLMFVKQQLEEKDMKIKDYEEMAKRARAEAENIRKRMEKEKGEIIKHANKNLLTNLLDFMDDFERALQTKVESEEAKNFYTGVEMIYKRMLTFMENFGVKEVDCVNEEFDPNLHEAIAMEEDEKYSEETVVDVFQKGYFIHGDLLRAPRVKIGKPVNPKQNTQANDDGKDVAE